MDQRVVLSSLSRTAFRPCAFCFQHPQLACFLLICIIFLLSVVSTVAQAAQQNVYGSTASQLVGFSIAASGGLTALAVVPFSDPQFQGGLISIDGHGKFLFLIDRVSSAVWMFQIQSDRRLKRVPSSPFFAPAPGNVRLSADHPNDRRRLGRAGRQARDDDCTVSSIICSHPCER
jgi:hypothetical protein